MQQHYRKGDLVNVQCEIRHDFYPDGNDKMIHVEISYQGIAVQPETVTLVRPFFKVGEVALLGGSDPEAGRDVSIVGIHDDTAWVIDDGGAYLSVKLKNLVRKPLGDAA